MALEPQDLDTRGFDELFEAARARIPRYAPEWTDFNDSDPGITLLQLYAWHCRHHVAHVGLAADAARSLVR